MKTGLFLPLFRLAFIVILTLMLVPNVTVLGSPETHMSQAAQGFALGRVGDIQRYLPTILGNVDMNAIRTHVEYLAGLGTRVTGYPGGEAAADYIYSKFIEFGLDKIGKVYKDYYYQPSIIDYGAKLEILSPTPRIITIYPLSPNAVTPPALPREGLTGRLVYVGKSSLKELKGKDLNGSIVLVDFNCLQEWVLPFMFGARAVIFIEPDSTNSYEADLKQIAVSLNLPRFYVKEDGARILLNLLRGQEVVVKITSRMVWENRLVSNVIGIINGTVNPDQIIQIWAYYDSSSVVPSVAPGADQATGVATLLEMARFFSKNVPGRTIMFVALSGHWQCVAGARYHIWKYFWGGEEKAIGAERTILTMGLDLSTDSDYFAFYFGAIPGGIPTLYGVDRHDWYDIREALKPIFYWGKPVEESTLVEWMKKALISENLYDESLVYYMVKNTNRSYLVSDGMAGMGYGQPGSPTNLFATPISLINLDTEPAAMAGAVAFSLRTSMNFRRFWGTPLDTVERVDFAKLRPQAEVAFATAFLYANLDGLENIVPKPKVQWDAIQARGFSVGHIRVVKYDFLTGRYMPVENAVVRVHLGRGFGHTPFTGAGHTMLGMTDKNGSVIIYGLRGAHGGTEIRYWLEAAVVEPETGNLLSAYDQGRYGARIYDPKIFPDREYKEYTTTVFDCGQIALLGIVDIRTQSAIKVAFVVNDVGSHAETLNFGSTGGIGIGLAPVNPWTMGGVAAAQDIGVPVHVVYVPPERNVEVLIYSGPELIGVLNNGGKGFNLKWGETLILAPVSFKIVEDLNSLNEERLSTANSYYLFSGGLRAETFHAKAKERFAEGKRLLPLKDYEKLHSALSSAWSYEFIAYVETRRLYDGAIASFTIFSFLLIAFTIFIDKLLELRKGVRRLLGVISVLVVFSILMFILHPGMRIASNAFMVMFGSAVLIMIVPIILIIISETKHHLEIAKREMMGIHFARISNVAAALVSFSMAALNIKKRKLRSFLTLVTLTIVVLSLVAFTSAYFFAGTRIIPTGEAPYNGLLFYRRGWVAMPMEVLRLLQTTVGENGVVTAKGFMPPVWAGPSQTEAIRGVGKTFRNATYRAIWGVMPEEKEFFDLETSLIKGRWFIPEDTWVAIVSDDIHEAGVDIGDGIIVFGNEFTVIGIVDRNLISAFKDLNNQGITPIDYVKEGMKTRAPGTAATEVPDRLTHNYVIIPFNTFLSIGGPIISVAAKLNDPSLVEPLAEDLLEQTHIDIYAGVPGGILLYRKAVEFVWTGLGMVIIPLFIGAFIIFSTMLNSVYERIKEIKICSSVGFSPTHVGLVFMSESLVFALFATVIGYIIGLLVIIGIQAIGQMPFGILNYSSFFVALTIIVATISTIASSTYPALKSSKMVTPSLERRYKLRKPRGDEWIIPMPFSIASSEELNAFLDYVKEFLHAHRSERIGNFMVSDISLKEEVVRGVKVVTLVSTVSLKPYEQGISQTAALRAVYDATSARYMFTLELKRITGIYTIWVQSNRWFIDDIRRQFIVWKGLSQEEKKRYMGGKQLV